MKQLIKTTAFFSALAFIISTGCTPKPDYQKVMHDPLLYSKTMHELNYVIIYDIFNPCVASRIFAYTNLAAYETLAKEGTHYTSLEGKIKSLSGIPAPKDKSKIDFPFASLIAMAEVGQALTFSQDRTSALIDSIKGLAKNSTMTEEMFDSSVSYGMQVSTAILAWGKKDNYPQTRGAKFSLSGLEGHWSPTPPGYFDAVEPRWMTIRTLALDSANQFPMPGPPPFSKDSTSDFYKMAKQVYDTGIALNPTQQWIANFWDCNAFKLHHEGHVMFATKAMSPPGHWMEIIGTISQSKHADFYQTVFNYAGASICMFDGFIACWWTKYHWDLIRPETYINQYIDPNWQPFLQTPPFPEYTSGHSVISSSACQFINRIYGDNTPFTDSSERDWGWKDRSFTSMNTAALEISASRFYGGIHYFKSVNDGYLLGKQIGDLVTDKLMLPTKQLAEK